MSQSPDPQIVYRRHEPAADRDRIGLPDGLAFAVRDGACLVHASRVASNVTASAYSLPRLSDFAVQNRVPIHEIASYRGEPVYTWPSPEQTAGLEPIRYRALLGLVPDAELALNGRALQINAWDETTRYCPCCGKATVPSTNELVKRCESCAHTQYPRLAPAMIVGVVRDERLLLAQLAGFRSRLHSILAGFVEPGETVEECVHREVWEEVGIRVRSVTYFGSEPWPCPHSLMLGFIATWESGELRPDPREIGHADWYDTNDLPEVPGGASISARIIQSIVRRRNCEVTA